MSQASDCHEVTDAEVETPKEPDVDGGAIIEALSLKNMKGTLKMFLQWSVLIILIICALVGGQWFILWSSGMLEDEHEMRFYWQVQVWMSPRVILYCVGIVVVSRGIGVEIIKDNSHAVPLKEAVRNSWTNMALISALLATIAASGWLVEAPEEEEINLRLGQWNAQFMASASLWAVAGTLIPTLNLLFTEGLSRLAFELYVFERPGMVGYPMACIFYCVVDLLVGLCIWTAMQHGPAACMAVVCLVIGGLIWMCFVIRILRSYENTVDGRFCRLEVLAKTKMRKNLWWYYVDTAAEDLENTLVPEELVSFIVKTGEHHLCVAGDSILSVVGIERYLTQMFEKGMRPTMTQTDALQPEANSLESLISMLWDGKLIPTNKKNRFFAMFSKTGEDPVAVIWK